MVTIARLVVVEEHKSVSRSSNCNPQLDRTVIGADELNLDDHNGGTTASSTTNTLHRSRVLQYWALNVVVLEFGA